MASPLAQQFVLNPPPTHSDVANTGIAFTAPAEAFETFYKLVDPELIYLNQLTRLLYSAQYVKTNQPDPESLLPGYKLAEMPGEKKVNWEGYNTIANVFLMDVGIAISTTEINTKEFRLLQFCIDKTMAIDDMLIANREKWNFTDFAFHVPFGMTIFYNLYAIASRSSNGGKMMNGMIKALNGILGSVGQQEDQNKPRIWNSPFKSNR